MHLPSRALPREHVPERRIDWLEANVDHRSVRVGFEDEPQLALMGGVCLAADVRWAAEMVADDGRWDDEVTISMARTANRNRKRLGVPVHTQWRASSIFGPAMRKMHAAFKVALNLGKTGQEAETEAYRRAGIEVEPRTAPKSALEAVISMFKALENDGRAVFLFSFTTRTGAHVVGLHGNVKYGGIRFFDPNLGIYVYGDAKAYALALQTLLTDVYNTRGGLRLRKVRLPISME